MTPTELLAAREDAAPLSASNDLTAFGKRGGTMHVVLEANNAFVPAPMVDEWLPKVKGVTPDVLRVKNCENPSELVRDIATGKRIAPPEPAKKPAPAPAPAAKKPASAAKEPASAPAPAEKKPAPAPAPKAK